MNRFICANRKEAKGYSQKRGKQPSTVGNYHYGGAAHGSQLALKMGNALLTVEALLILVLRKHSSGYLWRLFMASLSENLNFEVF